MVRFTRVTVLFLISFIVGVSCYAQDIVEGPIVLGYGDTYQVKNATFQPDFTNGLKIVFDITKMGAKPQDLSSQINTIARCINMHASNGVDIDDMDIYAVFHSEGTYTLYDQDAYRQKYKVSNPHYALIERLAEVGVKMYVCGQSLAARNVNSEEIHPRVNIALSAMTVLTDLQMKGYGLIKF